MTAPHRTARRIAITGSEGLIGRALTDALTAQGDEIRGLDLRGRGVTEGDILNPEDLIECIDGCVGVVHLAAVSRVVHGERDPDLCWRTNVGGTQNVLNAARAAGAWVVYASSREVYGQPDTLPANEDTPLRPVNIYGRSKAEAERIVQASGLPTAILRFSNVYGSTSDHADRVVPAFARQAALGLPLRVDGAHHTFDFTHLSDTVRGIRNVIAALDAGVRLPPIHLLTGSPTTLGELADAAVSLAGTGSPIQHAPPRSYDVSNFFGDRSRAEKVLAWRPEVPLHEGLRLLIDAFRAASASEGVH